MPVNIANIATLSRACLYQGQPATSAATVYTTPASTDVRVTEIILCNINTTQAGTVTINRVPSGGSAAAANRIVSALTVAANETVVLTLGTHMTAGDFLSAVQSTSGLITATISGEAYA